MLVYFEKLGMVELNYGLRVSAPREGELKLDLLERRWMGGSLESAEVHAVAEEDFLLVEGNDADFAALLCGLREYPDQFEVAVGDFLSDVDDVELSIIRATCERAANGLISWIECFGALAVPSWDSRFDDRFDLGLIRAHAAIVHARDEYWRDSLEAGIDQTRKVTVRILGSGS